MLEPTSAVLSLWSEVNDTNHSATEAPESKFALLISLSSIYTDINPIRMKRIPEDYIFRIQKFVLIYNSVEVLKP